MHSDLDYEVLRQSLPAGVIPAYDGMRLELESAARLEQEARWRQGHGGISMIGLFFEVETKPGHRDQYLDLAASLKPDLEAIGGCRFIDRFRSLTRENLLLSYQIWQDEGALTAWRAHAHHHDVQTLGRERVFSDYRIRVAQVIHEATARTAGLAARAAHALQRSRTAQADLYPRLGIEECHAGGGDRMAP